jgi:hypothetical protein
MSENIRDVVRSSETLLLELRELRQRGPLIRIVHRFRKPETECQAGEEVWGVYLIVRGHETLIRLSLALRLLLEYLARTRHVPQSATQIVAGLHKSQFCRQHSLNSGIIASRRFSRSGIKEYIKRVRKALDIAFCEGRLHLDSKDVLVSKCTVGNEKHYQLRARTEWVHID